MPWYVLSLNCNNFIQTRYFSAISRDWNPFSLITEVLWTCHCAAALSIFTACQSRFMFFRETCWQNFDLWIRLSKFVFHWNSAGSCSEPSWLCQVESKWKSLKWKQSRNSKWKVCGSALFETPAHIRSLKLKKLDCNWNCLLGTLGAAGISLDGFAD